MSNYRITRYTSPDYEWVSKSFLVWKSPKPIPVGAFNQLRANIHLLFNKDYAHPVDCSKIPAGIKIYVHKSKIDTAPSDRCSFCWSEFEPRDSASITSRTPQLNVWSYEGIEIVCRYPIQPTYLSLNGEKNWETDNIMSRGCLVILPCGCYGCLCKCPDSKN